MYNYFHTRSLKNLLDPKKMLCHVADMDIKYTPDDEASFITQVQGQDLSVVSAISHIFVFLPCII